MKYFYRSALVLISIVSIITFTYIPDLRSIGSDRSAAVVAGIEGSGGKGPNGADKRKIMDRYGKLPINFEPNVGQTDPSVKFVARGSGYTMFLAGDGATLSLRSQTKRAMVESAIRMRMQGAGAGAAAEPLEPTGGASNYLIGNDPSQWRTGVAHYGRVRFADVYPGIDVEYYGDGQTLEYDFVVAPNADPGSVQLVFEGAENVRVDKASGDLILETAAGTLRQLKPIVYQETPEGRQEVASSFRTENLSDGSFAVSFDIAEYDRSRTLVIDPVLVYGSYLGGNAFDEGRGITTDAEGNAYVTGTTSSLNFPTTPGVLKPVLLPRTDSPTSYWSDAFVTKIDPSGTAIVFSTYFGGRNGSEQGTDVTLDVGGNIVFAGTTTASDMPTVNAFQPTFGGTDDAFAAKINPAGSSIIYSTFLGGNSTDIGGRVALDPATGDAVFAGYASSGNFPTTPGVIKPQLCNNTPGSCNGIFYSGSYIVKLASSGSVVYSTLFDAGVNDVTLDTLDNALVGGTAFNNFPTTPGAFQRTSSGGIDGLVAKVNPSGTAIVYATYLGGGLQSDRVKAVAIDPAGNMYAVGQTENAGFPVTAGAFDGTFNGGEDTFITKLNPAGSDLVYSTFFGGTGRDQPFAMGLGTDDSVFIAGETTSGLTFPLKNSLIGTNGNIFAARLTPDATAMVFSTMLGVGGGYGMSVDAANSAFVTGATTSIVTTPNSFQPMRGSPDSTSSLKDAFVVKLGVTDENAPAYSISGSVTDDNFGFDNDYSPIVVTLTGPVSRSLTLPYSSNGVSPFFFGSVPGGGTYTVTARKAGYGTDPESVVFTNLGANQSADFHILRNRRPEGVITSPVHGTTFSAPASITIQATASDPDGDPIQKVDFVAYHSTQGNIPIGTDTTAPYEATWSNVPVGTYALYAIPTDSRGLRGISTEVVHVFVVDSTTPTVTITSPTDGQTFTEGQYVPLAAAVSSSITVLEFYDQNNTLIGRRTSAPWSTQWRVMQVGSYTITAKGFTSQGQSVTSTPVSITVGPINHRISGTVRNSITTLPVVGVTLTLTSQTNPNISAQTTTDANGAYLFTNLGTTPNDGVTITPSLAGYTFSPATRSMVYLGYIDWTNENFFATEVTGITVTMTSPTQGQVFNAPATIDLAANASSTAGPITRVDFYRSAATPVLLGTDTEAPYELPISGVAAGFYTYFARATDSTGAVAGSSAVSVTVNPGPSTVALHGEVHNPGGGAMPGITLRLTGMVNGSPVNQTAVSNFFGAYGFFNLTAGGDYTITPEAPNTTFTPPSASFTNVTSTILDINFTASAPNQAPSVQINSPANGAVFNMPEPVPINVTASDIDGTVAHLAISAEGNSRFTTIGQSNNGVLSFNWQPNLPGAYILWAEARDNGGLRTVISINITVNAQPGGVSISGRVVDRNSVGIAGATLELKDYPSETTTVATVSTDANGNYAMPNITTFQSYVLRASKPDHTFSPQRRFYFNLSTNQNTADFTGTLQLQPSDFDGDGGTDLAVWRPSNGVWHVSRSADNGYHSAQFGAGSLGDVVVPGNYDGDGKIDYAVYRGGIWYIMNSSNGAVRIESFGMAGDRPVPGDYDGDGKTDIAVWRPANGTWYITRSSDGAYDFRHFGMNGDVPLAGDYDGDGIFDLTIWRPETGDWYVMRSSDSAFTVFHFGMNGDIPLVGDFDGDKLADFTVFRPSTGVWYVMQSSNDAFRYFQWGLATDKLVPGDYDQDGKTDFAVFRESTGYWYIFRSASSTYTITKFGMAGDIPIPAAFVR